MGEILLYTIATLCALGVLAAVILYFVARKFQVYEDPRIDTVESMLPGANCGGCGYPGCRGFADALVQNDDISALYCPVGGAETMKLIAEYLGKIAPDKEPQIAEVRCNGSCDKRPAVNIYDGAPSCAIASSLYGGETGCTYGCLGKGDCVVVCNFDAIHVNPRTGLAEVDQEKCTACGACVTACPRAIIELRKKGPKNRRVYVSCVNKDKGAVAKKSCAVACIACRKCEKTCPFEAITVQNNLAYIDSFKCRLCRKCVPECPTNAIIEVNFPPRKPATEDQAKKPAGAPAPAPAKAKATTETRDSARTAPQDPAVEKAAVTRGESAPGEKTVAQTPTLKVVTPKTAGEINREKHDNTASPRQAQSDMADARAIAAADRAAGNTAVNGPQSEEKTENQPES